MNFAIGNINIEIIGQSFIAKNMKDILKLTGTENSNADLIFEFVDKLPPWAGQPYTVLDNYNIAANRIRVNEKLFCYELNYEVPAKVLIARRKINIIKSIRLTAAKSGRYFHTHGKGANLHYLKRFVYYLYMPLAELMLLKNRSSFSHCSAIEKDGTAVLFPAWGGVGKTGIMSRYLNDGWKFLSDDSCVIVSDGTACINPLPMHIYKYHEIQNRKLVEKMLAQTGAFDRLLWKVLSKVKKPDRLVRWVGADKVFGKDKISTHGKIAAVVHMCRRMKCNTFELKSVPPVEVAGLMASTIVGEINNLVDFSIAVHSCQPTDFIPDAASLYRRIADIYTNAFYKAKCYTITIPEQANTEDIYSFIQDRKLF
jgi:hypothetical protein